MFRRFATLLVLSVSIPALAADIAVLMRPTPLYIAPDTTSQRLTMAQRGIEAFPQEVDPPILDDRLEEHAGMGVGEARRDPAEADVPEQDGDTYAQPSFQWSVTRPDLLLQV